jgi:hypothetical protein
LKREKSAAEPILYLNVRQFGPIGLGFIFLIWEEDYLVKEAENSENPGNKPEEGLRQGDPRSIG